MVSVTVAGVLAFALPLGVASARIYRSRQVSRLEREATRAVGALPSSGLRGSDPVDLPPVPAGIEVAIYDREARRVAGHGPAVGDKEIRRALTGRISDDHDGPTLAVAVPIHDEEQIVGAARAAAPWSGVAHDTFVSWLAMAAVGSLAVALAAALASWQSRRLVEPVDGLAAMAVRLGDGDFSAQMAPTGVVEIDRAVDALNRTARRLGEIVTRERAFTANVSHQLKTPLTSLRLGLETALLAPGQDSATTLSRAVDEVERLQITVATLLAVAHEPHGVDARCDPAEVCHELAELVRPALARAGRPLDVEIDGALPLVRCPPEVLHEILAVLTDNAKRHGAGIVTISARAAGRGAVVEVRDEGIGVSSPATVFDRRPPDANGHGIGLPLARALADAHDARLELTRAQPHPVFTVALSGSSS